MKPLGHPMTAASAWVGATDVIAEPYASNATMGVATASGVSPTSGGVAENYE